MKDNFLHKIKQGYHEPDVDIDVDQIWANVEQNIETRNKRRGFLFYIGGLLLLAISTILIYSNYSPTGNTTARKITTKNTLNPIHENILTNKSVREIEKTPIQLSSDSSSILNESKEELPSFVSNINITKPMLKNPEYEAPTDREIVLDPLKSKNSQIIFSSILNISPSQKEAIIVAQEKYKNTPSNNTSQLSLLNINSLETLSPSLLKRSKIRIPDVNYIQLKKSSFNSGKGLSFEVFSGVSLFNDQLKARSTDFENLVQLRRSSTRTLESINFTGLISYNFNNSIAIKTGIDIRRFTSRFNYNHSYLEQLVQIGIDTIIRTGPETNDFVEISSTKEVSRTVHRQIQHYNHYNFINIPILISISLNRIKLKPKFDFGPIFNINSSLNGLTVDEGKMVFDIDENYFKPNFGVGAYLAIHSNYNITNHIEGIFGVQFNYYQNLKYNYQEHSQTLFSYGLKLGITYKI